MKKLIIILFSFITPIFNSGCLLEPDKEFITVYKDTLALHDTIHVQKILRDTVTKHDTIRITITKKDTLYKVDTVRTFAVSTVSTSLLGTWGGTVGTAYIRIAFSTEVYPYSEYAYSFNANIGDLSQNGYIKKVEGNNAAVVVGYAYSSNTANWIFSISNNILTIQQTGFALFPTMQAFNLKRIN